MIRYLQRTVKDESVKELESFRTGCWIFVENPSDSELAMLAESYGLERGLLDDAIDPNEVPRVESDGGVTYILTRVPQSDIEDVRTATLLIGVTPTFFFTVSHRHLSFLEAYRSGRTMFLTTQKVKLLGQIFSDINTSFRSHVLSISRVLHSNHIKAGRIDNTNILTLVRNEEVLSEFLSILMPTRALLQHILSGRFMKLYEYDEDLIEDVMLDNGQLIEMCNASLQGSVNMRNAYTAIMTNNLNRIIQLLTALTVISTVPTIIASLFGMNVRVPFGSTENGFFIILGITIIASVALLFIFQRRKWL